LVFDVDEFFSNGSYVIRSLSSKAIPFNFDFKFNEPGEYDFKVGEAPHKLSVLDAMSRKPIPNLKVSAWTKVQNGEALLIDSLQSDVNGEVTFFIATDIFKGGVYFSVKPFRISISTFTD
jgi:hypothetical protein